MNISQAEKFTEELAHCIV